MLRANYYYKTCLNILVNYYVNVFNDTKVEGMLTCLCLFNIDKLLENKTDIDLFKNVITNAIEFHRSASSSNGLADVPIVEI